MHINMWLKVRLVILSVSTMGLLVGILPDSYPWSKTDKDIVTGNSAELSTVPIPVGARVGVVAVGSYHSLARANNGTL
jgi:hypothetical protein